jgi:DNA-binding MarR family transcriptional regulator
MSLVLDDQLCFALYSTSHAMNRVYREPLRRLGLTYPQYLAMLVLWQQDGLAVSDIGARLFLDSATLTPLLKRLEAMGLVTRTRDEADERIVVVRLTEQGRVLKREARRVPLKIAEAMGVPLNQISDLKTELAALRGNLLASAQEEGTRTI